MGGYISGTLSRFQVTNCVLAADQIVIGENRVPITAYFVDQ
jgi:hypothetical protein